MIKKRRKEIYQPPYAQDLSGFSANGQVKPMGDCSNGTKPYEACVVGPEPEGGTNPACSAGTYPDAPKCEFGSMASVTCWGGGDAG